MKPNEEDIRKAINKAHRELQLNDKTGWYSNVSIHKNKRLYTRKNKHK